MDPPYRDFVQLKQCMMIHGHVPVETFLYRRNVFKMTASFLLNKLTDRDITVIFVRDTVTRHHDI